jgi:hypothetical protein
MPSWKSLIGGIHGMPLTSNMSNLIMLWNGMKEILLKLAIIFLNILKLLPHVNVSRCGEDIRHFRRCTMQEGLGTSCSGTNPFRSTLELFSNQEIICILFSSRLLSTHLLDCTMKLNQYAIDRSMRDVDLAGLLPCTRMR